MAPISKRAGLFLGLLERKTLDGYEAACIAEGEARACAVQAFSRRAVSRTDARGGSGRFGGGAATTAMPRRSRS